MNIVLRLEKINKEYTKDKDIESAIFKMNAAFEESKEYQYDVAVACFEEELHFRVYEEKWIKEFTKLKSDIEDSDSCSKMFAMIFQNVAFRGRDGLDIESFAFKKAIEGLTGNDFKKYESAAIESHYELLKLTSQGRYSESFVDFHIKESKGSAYEETVKDNLERLKKETAI